MFGMARPRSIIAGCMWSPRKWGGLSWRKPSVLQIQKKIRLKDHFVQKRFLFHSKKAMLWFFLFKLENPSNFYNYPLRWFT